MRRVWCTRRESRLTDSKTEPSSLSRHPSSERTNTNCRLNLQTEKDVKEPNLAPARGVICAQGVRRETCSKRINTKFASSRSCTDKYIQNYVKIPILESILEKTVGYVLSESKHLRKKSVSIIILDALSLKVTATNLLELSVSLMLIQENERKKITYCS